MIDGFMAQQFIARIYFEVTRIKISFREVNKEDPARRKIAASLSNDVDVYDVVISFRVQLNVINTIESRER